MRPRSTIAGLLLAAAVVGLSALLVSVEHRLTVQQARIEQQILRAERQSERLEAALRRLEGVASSSVITAGVGGQVEPDPRAIAPLRLMHHPSTPGAEVGTALRPGPAPLEAAAQRRQGPDSNAPRRGPALAAAFATESGSSAWGRGTADQITRAYEAEPFFAQFDGALKTDCRIATCRVTWTAPVVDPNDPELTMAKYELMALAAQKEPPVRRMQGVRRTEKGRTVIELYLAR